MITTTMSIAPHAIVGNIKIANNPILSEDYYINLALLYAKLGFYVFPVNPNKIPYKGFQWSKLATKDPDMIKQMWQAYPRGRPAFYCKPSGLVVLDTDNKPDKGKFGFKILRELVDKLGPLPKTVLVYTQSNGTHMYYRMPKNRVFIRKYANCIDIQTNHYCLCGGVYTEKGSYRFANGYTFEDIGNIPELPPNWVDFLSKKEEQIYCKTSARLSNQPKVEIEGDFKILYDNCLFCKMAVDEAQTLDENSWFKFASMLSNLKGGYELFDKFSKPHPKYDPQKTLAKFENAKKYTVNCKTIARDFEGCKNCKYNKERGK